MKAFWTAAGCTALAGAAASGIAAVVLFNRVIPRQYEVRVNLDEMADMKQWEEYKKIIHPNKDWFSANVSEHITIKSYDGLTLHADYIPAAEENSKGKLAICFHGYTSCGFNDCASISRFLNGLGFDCLVVDNRAHGKSEGDYVGFGILDRHDCISWINYVNERFDSKKDILLFGVSMGASTVLMAAGDDNFPKNVKAIIADCAFTSPYEVFTHVLKKDYKLPEFPIMQINDVICKKKAGYGFKDYSTLEAVKKTTCPILFVHGAKDNFVPTEMTKRNFEQCASPKEMLIVENAGHAASYYENSELYESKAMEFIEKYMPERKVW
ncbi:MAG: alpha/beta hydrolase [Oscillospiraceae bacterium]